MYLSRVKFAGTIIEVVSLPPNRLRCNITIELDALIFDVTAGDTLDSALRIDDGSNPIKESFKDYLNNYPFDEAFYISKLINAIQEVEGVKDVVINEAWIDGIPITRKIEEVSSGYIYPTNNIEVHYKF